jgi:quinol monooxygenase YgiN
MHIVLVHITVKQEAIDAFCRATAENARHSADEPGVARFDFLQNAEDPTRFVLLEVYRTPEDVARHKQTAHYDTWNQTAASMMAEPRTRGVFSNVFPPDKGWG